MFNNCTSSQKPYKRTEESVSYEVLSNFICDVVDLDKCVFKNKKFRRCDWLFLINKEKNRIEGLKKSKAFYVELKGVDIKLALEQLFNSIDKTRGAVINYDIEAKVISTKGFQPALINNSYFKKIKKIIKKDVLFHKVHKGNNYTYTERI